jgi:hypothetical protein
VAFGAPCFFGVGVGDGDSCGDAVGVGIGDAVSDGDDVSNGCGDGELCFFFRCGDPLGDGVGEVFFFRGVGEGDSSSADGVRFFLGDGVVAGAGDSFSRGVDKGFGVGVGVGDFFFVATALFFLRGLGVGVGVAKIFFSVCPRVGSAASFTAVAKVTHVSKMKMRRSISKWLDGEAY